MSEISIEKLEDLLEKLEACPSAKRVKFLNDISLAIVQHNKLSKKINRLERQIHSYSLLEN